MTRNQPSERSILKIEGERAVPLLRGVRVMAMAPSETKKRLFKAFIFAIVCDALCLCAGLIGYMLTLHYVWIVIGVLGGLGFVLPALIRLKRAAKEQDSASR